MSSTAEKRRPLWSAGLKSLWAACQEAILAACCTSNAGSRVAILLGFNVNQRFAFNVDLCLGCMLQSAGLTISNYICFWMQ